MIYYAYVMQWLAQVNQHNLNHTASKLYGVFQQIYSKQQSVVNCYDQDIH